MIDNKKIAIKEMFTNSFEEAKNTFDEIEILIKL
jgi:hypothetical protein